jgi:hypothetical protein
MNDGIHVRGRFGKSALMAAACTLACMAWSAEPGNEYGVSRDDVEKAYKPQFSP